MEGYSFLGKNSPRAQQLKVFITGVGYKTVTFEEDWSVQELCASVARKLRLPDEHLFGIFEVFGEPGVGREKCIKDSDTLKQKLSMSILPGRQFVFKYKYLIDHKITHADDRAMDMYYLQTKESVISGYYHTPLKVAVDLAAVQMQVEFGVFSRTHVPGFLLPRIRDFLPGALLTDTNAKAVEAEVLGVFSEIPEVEGMQKPQATLKRAYLSKAMTLSVFGCRFFEARQNKVRDFPKRFLLGVKSTGLVAVDHQDRTYIQDWSFDAISRWGNKTDDSTGQETLYIQLQSKGNRAKGLLWVIYTEAEAVCELLDKYSMEMFKTLSEEGRVQLTMTEEKAAMTILACYRGYRVRKRMYELFVRLNESAGRDAL